MITPVEPALDTCQVRPSGFRDEINSRLSWFVDLY